MSGTPSPTCRFHPTPRRTSVSAGDDDVGEAIQINVTHGHGDGGIGPGREGQEVPNGPREPCPGGAVEYPHGRSTAQARRRDDVGDGVAVDIGHRDPNAALEMGTERQEAELLQTRFRINYGDP